MRIKEKVLSLSVCLALGVSMPGCQTLNEFAVENPELTCGAGALFTGGAVWAVCNYGLGGNQAACITAAVAGAVADGLVCYWNLKQKMVQDYDQTQKAIGYDPSQGYVVRILDFSATPKIVKPGEKVMINAQFAVMSPNRNEEIKFERKFTLPGDNKPRSQTMTYQPGTWGVEGMPFDIDAQTPDGKVELTLELSLPDQNKQERRTLCFNIARSGQVAAQDLCPAFSSAPQINIAPKVAGWFTLPASKKPIALRDKADSKAKVSGSAPGGYKYPVLESIKQGKRTWYLIKLENEATGWIQSTAGKYQAGQ